MRWGFPRHAHSGWASFGWIVSFSVFLFHIGWWIWGEDRCQGESPWVVWAQCFPNKHAHVNHSEMLLSSGPLSAELTRSKDFWYTPREQWCYRCTSGFNEACSACLERPRHIPPWKARETSKPVQQWGVNYVSKVYLASESPRSESVLGL